MKKDIMSILPQAPLHDIIKTISQTNQLILPVIDDNNKHLSCNCSRNLGHGYSYPPGSC